jgi:hypothetical protein
MGEARTKYHDSLAGLSKLGEPVAKWQNERARIEGELSSLGTRRTVALQADDSKAADGLLREIERRERRRADLETMLRDQESVIGGAAMRAWELSAAVADESVQEAVAEALRAREALARIEPEYLEAVAVYRRAKFFSDGIAAAWPADARNVKNREAFVRWHVDHALGRNGAEPEPAFAWLAPRVF